MLVRVWSGMRAQRASPRADQRARTPRDVECSARMGVSTRSVNRAEFSLPQETPGRMSQPDRTVYVEPSFRAFHEWTPTLLRGAELIADGGTLRAAADLCDAMLADDRLLGVLNKRVHG